MIEIFTRTVFRNALGCMFIHVYNIDDNRMVVADLRRIIDDDDWLLWAQVVHTSLILPHCKVVGRVHVRWEPPVTLDPRRYRN